MLFKNQSGFSLVELMVASSILVVVSVILSQSMANIVKTNTQAMELSVGTNYRTLVRNMLRERNVAAAVDESMCRARLAPVLSQDDLSGLFNAVNREYDLNRFNPIADKNFDRLTIQKSYLQNPELLNESRAYQVNAPGVFQPSLLRPALIRLVQTEWIFDLLHKDQLEKTRPIRLKLAIRFLNDSYSLIECGFDQLATTISHIEACKTLGTDFEFVYDNFDGPGTGQCYAPMYDPCYNMANAALRANCEQTHAAYSGTQDYIVTHLAPLKTVFCQLMLQGKSYTFTFCTGVN